MPAKVPFEILWDRYGVPHIFATTDVELFYGFGWAQARSHANLLLRLYGQARGRASAYWGARYLPSDRWLETMDVPRRSGKWLAAQTGPFRECLDAFAAGVNAYAREHAESVAHDLRVVLPVEARDVIAHAQRVLNFSMVVNPEEVARGSKLKSRTGSNAWAVGPSRSISGRPILLTNPHIPWGDFFRCFEAHLSLNGRNAYGISFVGFPVLVMAFNDVLGWAHTVNTHKGWTLYELEPAAGGYVLDGRRSEFEFEEKTLNVRMEDGSVDIESLTVRRSIHGPVVGEEEGRPLALRVAGLDRPCALHQWWTMAWSRDLREFEDSLRTMQIPMFTVLYAGRDGHIMHFFNGQVPIRPSGDYASWDSVVPGNTSATLWTETHDYEELPRTVDPPSGWLHNANDPPWTTTFPVVLNPNDYPAYVAPRGPMSLRAQRSARLLMSRDKFSFDDIVQAKYCTKMELADRLVDELVQAAIASGRPDARRGAEVLATWDRNADPGSRGAVLFVSWWNRLDPDRVFLEPWDEVRPLSTPRGLADPAAAVAALESAVANVEAQYGCLEVPWGEVFELRAPGVRVPALGADKVGVFPELWFIPAGNNRFAAIGGDAYTSVVEFSDPIRAQVLTIHGNSTQPDAQPGLSQMPIFAAKKLRPALLERQKILEQLSFSDRLKLSLTSGGASSEHRAPPPAFPGT